MEHHENEVSKIPDKESSPPRQSEFKKRLYAPSFSVKLDALSIAGILLYIIISQFMLGFINEGYTTRITMYLCSISGLVVGISGYLFFARIFQMPCTIDHNRFWEDFIISAGCFAIILVYVAISTQFRQSSIFGIPDLILLEHVLEVGASITEEVFFALFLGTVLFSLCKKKYQKYIINLGLSALFMVGHIFVYEDPAVLLEMFVYRFMFDTMYIETHRLSMPMLFHFIINLTAAIYTIL